MHVRKNEISDRNHFPRLTRKKARYREELFDFLRGRSIADESFRIGLRRGPINSHHADARLIGINSMCSWILHEKSVLMNFCIRGDRARAQPLRTMDYRCGSNGNISFLSIARSRLPIRRRGRLRRESKRCAIDSMTLTEFEISTGSSCLSASAPFVRTVRFGCGSKGIF